MTRSTFLDDDSHRVVDKKNCQWMAIGCNSPLQKQYPTKCKTFSLTQISSVDKNDRNSKNRKENIVYNPYCGNKSYQISDRNASNNQK